MGAHLSAPRGGPAGRGFRADVEGAAAAALMVKGDSRHWGAAGRAVGSGVVPALPIRPASRAGRPGRGTSPPWGLPEDADLVLEFLRKPTRPECGSPNLLEERGGMLQHEGRMSLRIEHSDNLGQPAPYQTNGFQQIRVIGDQRGAIIPVLVPIGYQMGSQVDIRSLLLGLEDFDMPGPPGTGAARGIRTEWVR